MSLVTVAFDPDSGSFPAEPLTGIEGEVVSVVEHFFHHAGLPHLLLVVHHRGPAPRAPRKSGRSKTQHVIDSLTEEERALFDRLRTWRQSRALADGVPVYVVLNNAQLSAFARDRPRSLSALRQIEGVGENKLAQYGKDLFCDGDDRVARVVSGPPPGVPRSEGRGVPIGSLTSQHLANLYLGALDHYVTDELGFGRYVRYMDDFLIFGERAGREPQPERAVQPERRRRFSRGEVKPGECEPLLSARTGPVETASRSSLLRPGLDQTPAPCLVSRPLDIS